MGQMALEKNIKFFKAHKSFQAAYSKFWAILFSIDSRRFLISPFSLQYLPLTLTQIRICFHLCLIPYWLIVLILLVYTGGGRALGVIGNWFVLHFLHSLKTLWWNSCTSYFLLHLDLLRPLLKSGKWK